MPRRDVVVAGTRHPRYEIELPGRLNPALLSSLAAAGAKASTVESVFTLGRSSDLALPEVAALLHEHGLVVLGIRKLPAPAPDREELP